MKLGHRLRLTLTAWLSAAVILAVVFGAICRLSQGLNDSADQDLLDSAIRLATGELKEDPQQPDLSEIAESDREISLAIFPTSRQPATSVGTIHLSPTLGVGRSAVDGQPVFLAMRRKGPYIIEAALPLGRQARAESELAGLLALLWGPLAAVAALAVWLASRSTFSPLKAMSQEAATLSTRDLSRRISVPEDPEYAPFANQLNAYLGRLEASVKEQERFAADAAHEIRTPLTILSASIEQALAGKRVSEDTRQLLTGLQKEVDRLSSLVEVLLQTTAVEAAQSDPIDAASVAEEAHARWIDRFMADRVELSLELQPAAVRIRPSELEAVLDNLLSNALRASPEGTQCLLQLRQEQSRVRLTVADQGPGVPDEYREAIFERFMRVDIGRNRKQGGFGIGLAVCKRLVESRGGGIRIESNEPSGARFVIEFPRAA